MASVAEVAALADAIDDRLRALVLLAASCGLRRGELLALRRRDLDLLHGTVRVERTVHHLRGGTMVLGPPKTAVGHRRVVTPPHIVAEVESHLDAWVAAGPEALMFTTKAGDQLHPFMVQRAWEAARKAVGRGDLRFHDRATPATPWRSATGASTKELMARMGHASPQAALIYQHATEDRDRAIAEALSEMAGRSTVVPLRPARDHSGDSLGHIQVTPGPSGPASESPQASDQDIYQYPQRDSNPCCRLERAVS